MDPMTATRATEILKRNSAQIMEEPAPHVTMIASALNTAAEQVAGLIDRARSLTQNLRTAGDQVYGEQQPEGEVAVPEIVPGSAGTLQAQIIELDRWMAAAELQAQRLCGAA